MALRRGEKKGVTKRVGEERIRTSKSGEDENSSSIHESSRRGYLLHSAHPCVMQG